jgi:ubiquinone/menaquinone biosynthesis C-methylase UbiE
MQKESLEVFFSSASEGDIPANLVKILENDGILKQRFVVGDYAVGEKGIPTVKKVADQMGDIEYVPMVADSYKLPFANEALDVIHERMGALFHGVESGLGEVQTLIKEYARVMKRGGVLILDSTHSNKRLPSSTVKDLQKIADVGELFSDLGFELAGESGDEDEKYLILKRK